MPRKKQKIDPILVEPRGGYVAESIQRPSPKDIETIEKFGEKKIEVEEKKKKITEKVEKKEQYTLIICEKPQAAMKIAYALSETSPSRNSLFGVPYYEIQKENKKIVIVSAVGHLFGLSEKEHTKSWPVFNIEWQARTGFTKKYIDTISHFAKDASSFIIATDYDIEGELIGFNALRFICRKEEAKRMKFSTLTKYDLEQSFKDILEHFDYGQAYAGETRHYLDWFYGINLSRALMQAIQAAGSYRIMSIGRVQGPALALVVSKEKEI